MHFPISITLLLISVAGVTFFIFKKNEKKTSQVDNGTKDTKAFKWFQRLFKKSEPISVVPIMTYDEAFKYFVQERPKNPEIKKGAISRKKHPEGYLLAWAFLDQDEELVLDENRNPYGRQLIVQELDEELAETFGDTDLIIVQ